MISDNTDYYEGYSWLFDDTLIEVENDLKISDNCILITIYYGDILPFECEDCYNRKLQEECKNLFNDETKDD